MSTPASDEYTRLLLSLFEEGSVLDRYRSLDPRIATLARLAAFGDDRLVPSLLALLAVNDSLAPHAARAIADLVRPLAPGRLAWLDEHIRHGYYRWGDAWGTLTPDAVMGLAQTADFDPLVIGLVASHPNGYVRAAALEQLARSTSGQDIRFLALRANDWVEPVAARATELLASRLRSENRLAVLDALPFIVRLLEGRRRDHREIQRALRAVLISDGGEDALTRAAGFKTAVRRKMYELLTHEVSPFQRRLIEAAARDPDVVIRARAIRWAGSDADFDDRAGILERALSHDPVPLIRSLALTMLSEHMPERIAGLFPNILLDRAASVRAHARFVIGAHQLPLVPRDVYVQRLDGTVTTQIGVAIEGVGETGARADAERILGFLRSDAPRLRRSALHALARLDAERANALAIEALGDHASTVRSVAIDILTANARSVNFELVNDRARSLPDPSARRQVLRLLKNAPKWDAPAFLLEALRDPDDSVRSLASRLLDLWIERFNRNQTQPTAAQLHRIDTLLDSAAPYVSEERVRSLRGNIRPW
jgi:HEAT repeat protein